MDLRRYAREGYEMISHQSEVVEAGVPVPGAAAYHAPRGRTGRLPAALRRPLQPMIRGALNF